MARYFVESLSARQVDTEKMYPRIEAYLEEQGLDQHEGR